MNYWLYFYFDNFPYTRYKQISLRVRDCLCGSTTFVSGGVMSHVNTTMYCHRARCTNDYSTIIIFFIKYTTFFVVTFSPLC